MCMMFFNNLNGMFSQLDCILFLEVAKCFCRRFRCFRNLMRRCEWTRMFLEQHGEFKEVEFTPFASEKKFVENVYFCMPPLPFYNTEQTSWNKRSSNMHAACLHEPTAQTVYFRRFPVWKRELSFAVTAVVFWGICFVKRSTRS